MKMPRFHVGDRARCVRVPAFRLSVFEGELSTSDSHIAGELTSGWVYEIKGAYLLSENIQYVIVMDDLGRLVDYRADHFQPIGQSDSRRNIDAA